MIYGSASGVTSAGASCGPRTAPVIARRGRGGDSFGAALASGDLNGDGPDDLAIGVPAENDRDDEPGAGAVNVIYGCGGGLTSTGNQLWTPEQHRTSSTRPTPTNRSASRSPRPTSTATATPTSPSAYPARASGRFGPAAPSTRSTAPARASPRPATSSGRQNSAGVLELGRGRRLVRRRAGRRRRRPRRARRPGDRRSVESVGTVAAGALNVTLRLRRRAKLGRQPALEPGQRRHPRSGRGGRSVRSGDGSRTLTRSWLHALAACALTLAVGAPSAAGHAVDDLIPAGATEPEIRAIETAMLGAEHAAEHAAAAAAPARRARGDPAGRRHEDGLFLRERRRAPGRRAAVTGRCLDPGAVPDPDLRDPLGDAADRQGAVLGPPAASLESARPARTTPRRRSGTRRGGPGRGRSPTSTRR